MAQAPTITSAVSNAPGWITIAWAHGGQDGVLGYRLSRQDSGTPYSTNANVGTFTDTGLTPSTTYSYRMCAVYPDGSEECTDWVSVKTLPSEDQPPVHTRPAPTISVHEVGPDFITVKWSGRRYDRVHLRWRKDGYPLEAQIDIDHDEAVGYRRFDRLEHSTRYTFRIQACDVNFVGVANCGEWSWPPFPISTTGPALPPPPPPIDPVYAVMPDGKLMWYRHEGQRDGTFKWASNQGKEVSRGWDAFAQVFPGGDGVIYAITAAGDLLWHRHDGWQDGTSTWATPQGKKVGSGWNAFIHVFSAGHGTIYGARGNGDLMFYEHLGHSDGSFRWTANEGRNVTSGWAMKQTFFAAQRLFSGGHGNAVYALMDNGDLLWFRHMGMGNGTPTWVANDGRKVGNGWDVQQIFTAGDGGVIYAIAPNGDMLWYRHDGQLDGQFRWLNDVGKKVGHGWAVRQAFST